MPSPFRGMDPYIEDPFFWSDCHTSMMTVMREVLNSRLPSRYVASVERHVWVQERNGDETVYLGTPDVQVTDGTREPEDGAVTAVLPVTRSQGNRYSRILDRRRRVVTVIELLSPCNKTTGGYGVAYRQKRWDYLAGGVNLVEIDFLRAGERPPLGDPPPPPSDYYLLICTAPSFPQMGIWPLSVRDPIPVLPVPLGPGEEPVPLDLRACLDRVYDGGRYHDEIDYAGPANPPLREPDAAWARELLAAR